jgi:hypothetical protein
MAQVVARDEQFKPPISSDLITMPAVQVKLLYSEGPAGVLRNLPAQWNLFLKHFKEKFDPRYKMRQELLFKQMVNDVRDWEIAAEEMPNDKRQAFVSKMNTELQEWLNRWMKIVEKDCTLSCDEAYQQTIKEIKGKVSSDHFSASAKATAITSIKIAAAVAHPAAGLIEIGKEILSGGKSLKQTTDKFLQEWGTLGTLVDAINVDIAAVKNAINAHERSLAPGADKAAQLSGLWNAVQAPANKLASDVVRLDQMIALSRQHVQEQSTMITALEAGLKKAGAGGDLDKARAHLAAEKEARMRMAAELARASEVKNDAKEVYEKMKSSQIPEFAKLTKSLGQVKKGKELADSIGKEAGELVNSIMDWVQHLK